MSLQTCGLNRNHAGRELKPHGTPEFPCAGYETHLKGGTEQVISWHWHEELELVYVKKGTLKLQVPFHEFIMEAGELAVINSNTLHYAEGISPCILQSLVCSPLLLTGSSSSAFAVKYIQPLLSCPGFTCVLLADHPDHPEDSFLQAFEALRADAFAYEFTVREQLSRILLQVFRIFEDILRLPRQAPDGDTLRMEQMLEYMHSHFSQAIGLKEIAGAAHIGERECLRCFRRAIGDSPIQYLLKYRLMRSAEMLLSEPGRSIAHISSACGFDYPGYYSKQFKRFYQCSPREYRKSTALLSNNTKEILP